MKLSKVKLRPSLRSFLNFFLHPFCGFSFSSKSFFLLKFHRVVVGFSLFLFSKEDFNLKEDSSIIYLFGFFFIVSIFMSYDF